MAPWVIGLIALVLFGMFTLARQVYFLGTDEDGRVAVYRGLPYDLPFGVERLPSIYGFWGSWLALTLFTYPYTYLSVRAACRGLDVRPPCAIDASLPYERPA